MPCARRSRRSSATSRSRRSAISRTRSCSRPSAPRAATASTHRSDVARLRTILRLQRDEYLPLRVIRQELSAGRSEDELPPRSAAALARQPPLQPDRRAGTDALRRRRRPRRHRRAGRPGQGADRLRPRHRINAAPARPTSIETEREIIRAVTELVRYGVSGRNLRVFKTSADREAALLEQIFAPALRSRSREATRRRG